MKQLPKKFINKNTTDDEISQDNNSVDFFASDFVNAQEHARLIGAALAGGLSYQGAPGSYFSRGGLILQGMEYMDKGGGLVDIKEGYFCDPVKQEVIYFDGVEYTYQVEDYFEVEPEDVRVLEQRFNEQTLSLVTCVPPGTYKKRGIVKARLVLK